MILRRVIAHFRRQEWTAIALDFFIVVFGVYIGIQVSNWNAARLEASALRAGADIVPLLRLRAMNARTQHSNLTFANQDILAMLHAIAGEAE